MSAITVEEAARILRSGGVVVAPTETVVGLFASRAGLERIYEVKGREPGKPVALLCRSAEEAFGRAARVPALARRLAAILWPGPLTLVLDSPGGGTVGVRVPDHGLVQRLLEAFGGPLYATSANLSGEPAPGALSEVDPGVLEKVDGVLEGDPGGGRASAVVDLSGGKVCLLRAGGGLDEKELERLSRE